MIPNHARFIKAIHERKKVRVRFDSKGDLGMLDRVCAPMDYGPGGEMQDGVNRYWLWDYASTTGFHTLDLLPDQIWGMQILDEAFDPARLDGKPSDWSIPRDWRSPSQPTPGSIHACAIHRHCPSRWRAGATV